MVLIGDVELERAAARHDEDRRIPEIFVLRDPDPVAHDAVGADLGPRGAAGCVKAADQRFIGLVEVRKLVEHRRHLGIDLAEHARPQDAEIFACGKGQQPRPGQSERGCKVPASHRNTPVREQGLP
jgi:hypothetical protein